MTYEEAQERAIHIVAASGFPMPGAPLLRVDQLSDNRQALAWPADPSDLSDRHLSMWQSSLAGWSAYAHAQQAVAAAVKAEADHARASARAVAIARTEGNITTKRTAADADPAHIEANAVYAQAKARVALYEGQVEGIKARQMCLAQERKARSVAFGPQAPSNEAPRGDEGWSAQYDG